MNKKILKLPQVKAITALSTSSIYKKMTDGEFPRSIKLGGTSGRAVGWLESDIEAWLDEKIAESSLLTDKEAK